MATYQDNNDNPARMITRPGVARRRIRRRARQAGGIAVLIAAATTAHAADATSSASTADKSQYTLLNPTPEHLMREMSTDRPDITEVPFTVDPGHVQVEASLLSYARSAPGDGGATTSAYEFAPANIRIGVTHDTEINFVWQPYGVIRSRSPGNPPATARNAGIGSAALRAKINLWGNDTFTEPGSTALALLPFVTFPTDRGNGISTTHMDFGLNVPFAAKLSDRFELGINAGLHAIKSDLAPDYHLEWFGSMAVSYEWTDRFGSYVEVATRLNTQDPRGDIGLVGAGLTYKVHDNLQLDAGVNFGVTPAADRINPFVGLSARF